MTLTRRRDAEVGEPFQLLGEAAGGTAYPLPHRLAELYAGALGFDTPCIYANFVTSVDGVAALGKEDFSSGTVISGGVPADRFLMGLLRACADAVLIGAGTLRGSPGHRWTPDHVYPAAAGDFAELRRRLGRTASPPLVVVSASGDLDATHPGLRPGTVVLTTDAGVRRLRGRLGEDIVVRSLGGGERIAAERIVDALTEDGLRVVLTEGGPTVIGQLLAARLLDELFLTVSPVLFGREPAEPRPGMVDGVGFVAAEAPPLHLRSVRRQQSHLFLHYAVGRPTA